MIWKGWVDTFIWVSTGCSIWAQNVFARSNGFRNRNFDSYLWLSPNIGNLQVGSAKRKKKWKMNHHSLLSEKKWTNVALNRKTWPISLDHVMIFFPSCDFLSKGEQIARVIRQKAKRGFIIFSYLSSTYYLYAHARKIFQCNLHILAHCRSKRKIDWKFEKWSQKRFPYINITFF